MTIARPGPTSLARSRSSACAAVLALLLLAVACAQPAQPPSTHKPAGKRVDAATTASITGRVAFAGRIPRNEAVSMSSDAYCAHANPGQPINEAVVVGPAGGLQNAFVYVTDDLSGYAFDVPAQPARLQQAGCRFRPHVVGLQVGQALEIANSDDTLHNVRAITKINDDFNVAAVQGSVTRRSFASPEIMVRIKCDVHGWMSAYAGVVAHPYFAVTDADGRFALKGLPPGDYTVAAWHETFGTRTARLTVGPRENKEVAFEFGTP